MEATVRRYFWIVGVIVVMLCAVFAAYGVNHFVEAKFLADRKEAKELPRVASASSSAKTRTKDGEPVVKRNMFCSDCIIAEATTADGPIVDSNAPPATSLPLRLVATNVSTDPGSSFATIQNTSTGSQGSYWISETEKLPGAGKIVRINGKHVDFNNPTAGRVERLSLLATGPAPKPTTTTNAKTKRSKKKSERDELLAAIDEGVKKTGDNAWDIDRAVVNKVLANPTAVGRGARIVPSIKNGKPNGFKLYAIRPSSVYSKIGLMNGDTIHSVNGFDLTTPDKALEVYTKVRESNNLSVTVTRRGKPVSLKYSIK